MTQHSFEGRQIFVPGQWTRTETFYGLLYAAVRWHSKVPQGGDPASSRLAGGGRGRRGALCVRPIRTSTAFFGPPRASTALFWSRGASRYFRNHAEGAAGDMVGGEGAAQLRRGHQTSTISKREEVFGKKGVKLEESLRRRRWLGGSESRWRLWLGWPVPSLVGS